MLKTLIVRVSLVSVAFAQQNEVPKELEVLTSQYERAVEKALEPITAKYLAALKKLKGKFTTQQKLEQALAVDAVLTDLIDESDKQFNSLAEVFGKTFSWRANGTDLGFRLILQKDGTGTMRSISIKWKKTGDRETRITFLDGEIADLKWNLRYTEFTGKESRYGGQRIFGKLVK
ncbi:hypothetical protein N8651_04040 [Akkermansiaceae bacterium]|nr:hypothetical protein [Akkermansiaceae bacterium]